MKSEEQRPIVEVVKTIHHICSGCGGYTADGEPTGNPNIKSFRLRTGDSGYIITYCNECAEEAGLTLLRAWNE